MIEIRNKVMFYAKPCPLVAYGLFELSCHIWMREVYHVKDESFRKEG